MIANSPAAWSERAAHGASHEAVMWSEAGQRERFAVVLAALQPQPGESLLDYGCGTGALFDHLPAGVAYTGYDWSEGMIQRARREHPEALFSAWIHPYTIGQGPWNLVACIGPFNLADGWSKEQTWETLADLWPRTGRALAACLYAGDDPDCISYLDSECITFGKSTCKNWSLARHRANDLLLVLRR